jgi:hypothetical protein
MLIHSGPVYTLCGGRNQRLPQTRGGTTHGAHDARHINVCAVRCLYTTRHTALVSSFRIAGVLASGGPRPAPVRYRLMPMPCWCWRMPWHLGNVGLHVGRSCRGGGAEVALSKPVRFGWSPKVLLAGVRTLRCCGFRLAHETRCCSR